MLACNITNGHIESLSLRCRICCLFGDILIIKISIDNCISSIIYDL